jgi:hypothetical protein
MVTMVFSKIAAQEISQPHNTLGNPSDDIITQPNKNYMPLPYKGY